MKKTDNQSRNVGYLVEGRRDAQGRPVFAKCTMCKEDIFMGQPYYHLDQGITCFECLVGYARNYFLGSLRTAMPDVDREEKKEYDT